LALRAPNRANDSSASCHNDEGGAGPGSRPPFTNDLPAFA
jgi:hypothetical protein